MMYDTTVCCMSSQFLVNPIKSGVLSLTCSFGGLFHDGIGGRSLADFAFAARGKLSTIGGGRSVRSGLYSGCRGSGGGPGGGLGASGVLLMPVRMELLNHVDRARAMRTKTVRGRMLRFKGRAIEGIRGRKEMLGVLVVVRRSILQRSMKVRAIGSKCLSQC